MIRKSIYFTLLSLFIFVQSTPAQGISSLQLEEIMQGDRWIGHQPGSPVWSQDSRQIYFSWNPEGHLSDSLYSYNLKSSETLKVSQQEKKMMPPSRVVYNKKRDKMVYVSNGDLFISDLRKEQTRQLTKTLQSVSSPSFTLDEKAISYVAGNNLFVFHLEDGTIEQLTDFRTGKESADPKLSNQ
ncbi:MAG: DPP IV N-terminal domain-containing protein, partial [Bacteroidales bacterium]